MKVEIKLTGALHEKIMQDLRRLHPFAHERVGFVHGRLGSLADGGKLILLTAYKSIPDDQYEVDPSVGAKIGTEAITVATQAVYFGRPKREGLFHVHLHGHKGEPEMSLVDKREIPKLMPGFRSVGREAPHGIIIFSSNHGVGWVWLPTRDRSLAAAAISAIGAPIHVFQRRIAP